MDFGFFWAEEDDWRQAHNCLKLLFDQYGSALDPVREAALEVRTNLREHFVFFDRYGVAVCPGCREACCRHARAAFDFKDLLFMHSLGLSIPPHQTRRREDETCRYLDVHGCRLERIERPFICTWYYCAPLLDLLRHLPAETRQNLDHGMAAAKQARQRMEEVFIRTVSP